MSLRPDRQIHTSRCGEVKLRGTKEQIAQKYQDLATQADKDKDRVLAETYRQHAEHYVRMA